LSITWQAQDRLTYCIRELRFKAWLNLYTHRVIITFLQSLTLSCNSTIFVQLPRSSNIFPCCTDVMPPPVNSRNRRLPGRKQGNKQENMSKEKKNILIFCECPNQKLIRWAAEEAVVAATGDIMFAS